MTDLLDRLAAIEKDLGKVATEIERLGKSAEQKKENYIAAIYWGREDSFQTFLGGSCQEGGGSCQDGRGVAICKEGFGRTASYSRSACC